MPSSKLSSSIHLFETFQSSSKQPEATYLIYFITGNPGLIEYYRTFLTHLYGILATEKAWAHSIAFEVYGRSLSGFEVDSYERKSGPQVPPHSLQEQIAHTESSVERVAQKIRKERSGGDVKVILIGHSVGAYILLEVIRRLRVKAEEEGDEQVRIVGGVCLFPTVTHIARSKSGKRSGWLLTLPPFARAASLVAKALTLLFPTPFLGSVISTILSFPLDAAHVTASFIKSPHGVRQALYMAGHEMLEITHDTWDAEIWGASHPTSHSHPRPILRFLFAQEDHWVADETRDALIKARGKGAKAQGKSSGDDDEDGGDDDERVEEWKPVMEVDEVEGWPHGFCIKHSVPVAERVFGYVFDIIGRSGMGGR